MADDDEVQLTTARSTFDLATLLGFLSGFGLVAAAIILGGSPSSFINLPSVLIVIGGTLAVTTICFSLRDMARTASIILKTIFHANREPADAALQVLQIAIMARRQSVLALQDTLDTLRSEPFLHNGISMLVDGMKGGEVEDIMGRDMHATTARHHRSANVLRRAAEFSPAMGLIGTLIGLVQMLGNLDDPTTIGPSMAVALLTTFYGAVLANMVFLPLAAKLERNSLLEEMVNSVYLLGAASIGRQENPRRLEMLLNSMLPPAQQIQYFERWSNISELAPDTENN